VLVDVREADVLRDDLPLVDVVVANIELAVVEVVLAHRSALARTVVTSGYLAGERPRAPAWNLARELEREGWAAHVFVAK
jgi:hypothetical protein